MTIWRNRIVGLEYHRPEDIADHPLQWRTHSGVQEAALRAILKEVGIAGALLAYKQNGKLVAIDGHLRKSLDADAEWPVLLLDVTETEANKLLVTVDPLAAMADADAAVLESLMAQVETENESLQALLDGLAEEYDISFGDEPPEDPGAQIDRAEELRQKWGVETGQVWELGEHRLVCGDCTDPQVVAAVMRGERAGAVVTDPPYGIGLDTDYTGMPETRIHSRQYSLVQNDDKPFDFRAHYNQFSEVGEQFWWGADYFYDQLPPGGSFLVWVKRNENSTGLIGNHFEVCWSRAPHRRTVLFEHWSGVNARNPGMERIHPTEKSIKVLSSIISDYCGDVVIDPFLGSGTTLAACERLGRRGRGIEISPAYCAVSIQRLVDMGLEATLIDSVEHAKET